MNELFESLDINDEMKGQLSEAFEKAVLAKSVEMMDEHVETKVAEKEEILKEEFAEKVEALEDTLDGYMTSVVEEFVAQNAPTYKAEIEDEKAKQLLEMFDKMLVVAGVSMEDIKEARSERDINEDANSLENQIARLEDRLSETQNDLAGSRREADKFLKGGIIAETKEGLTLVEGEKFEKLAEMVTFERSDAYVAALDTIKESIVDSRDGEVAVVEGTLPSDTFKTGAVDAKAATDYSKYV